MQRRPLPSAMLLPGSSAHCMSDPDKAHRMRYALRQGLEARLGVERRGSGCATGLGFIVQSSGVPNEELQGWGRGQ
eukprot:909345-Rhodomonas_salina.1